MKKRLFSFILTACMIVTMLAVIAPAQAVSGDEGRTMVNFNIGSDYTFKSGMIYQICLNPDNSAITVERGATLTVEAGAIIEFGVNGNVHDSGNKNYGDRLIVHGALKIKGTADDPVIVRPQYGGDWANCTGIVLEADQETGGDVSLEASYCSFTGGGMEGRAWMGGIISVHGHGDVEQSYVVKLDHCSLQGSSNPWEYPNIYNSPDGTYALGFQPGLYGAGICVSAEKKPLTVELNNCTFGAEGAPLGAAIIDSDYADGACHKWYIKDCTFTNCHDSAYRTHSMLRSVIALDAPAEFVMSGCYIETSETQPVPVSYRNDIAFRVNHGEYSVSGCDMDFEANDRTVTSTWYSVKYSTMPANLSDVPLREVRVKDDVVLMVGDVTGEGMWAYTRFNLCIADGGRIDVAEGSELRADGADRTSYIRMQLGKGASVRGLDLYENDGETKITYPTSEAMSFVYISKEYSNAPYHDYPRGKWVRIAEPTVPATGVKIAEGEEVWITSGASNYSDFHAAALPENATDTAAFWIVKNNMPYESKQVWDNQLSGYKAGLLQVRETNGKSADGTLIAYSRDNAIFKTITVHFRPSDDPEMTSVTGVTLDKDDPKIEVGKTLQLKATVAPEDATTKNVWWVSGDERVATVDQNGVVTGIKEGTAIIAVTTLDCPTTARCTVTVTKNDTPPEEPTYSFFGVLISDTDGKINRGGGYRLSYPNNEFGDELLDTSTNNMVKNGDRVTVTAVPAEGFRFVGWYQGEPDPASGEKRYKGNALSTDPVYEFTAPIPLERPYICAVFEPGVPNPFTDVPNGKWYTNAILWCNENGYMNGTSESTFSPDVPSNRAMFVTILAKIDRADTSTYEGTSFTDVPEGKWFSKPIQWAYKNGYASGVGKDLFGPSNPVTREQLAVFLYNYTQKKGYNAGPSADISGYSDVSNISKWAVSGMQWAVGNALISGTSATTLSPKGVASRAQVALIIKNYVEKFLG